MLSMDFTWTRKSESGMGTTLKWMLTRASFPLTCTYNVLIFV